MRPEAEYIIARRFLGSNSPRFPLEQPGVAVSSGQESHHRPRAQEERIAAPAADKETVASCSEENLPDPARALMLPTPALWLRRSIQPRCKRFHHDQRSFFDTQRSKSLSFGTFPVRNGGVPQNTCSRASLRRLALRRAAAAEYGDLMSNVLTCPNARPRPGFFWREPCAYFRSPSSPLACLGAQPMAS